MRLKEYCQGDKGTRGSYLKPAFFFCCVYLNTLILECSFCLYLISWHLETGAERCKCVVGNPYPLLISWSLSLFKCCQITWQSLKLILYNGSPVMVVETNIFLLNMADTQLILQKTECSREMGNSSGYFYLGMPVSFIWVLLNNCVYMAENLMLIIRGD